MRSQSSHVLTVFVGNSEGASVSMEHPGDKVDG